jgi:hypothetical protein
MLRQWIKCSNESWAVHLTYDRIPTPYLCPKVQDTQFAGYDVDTISSSKCNVCQTFIRGIWKQAEILYIHAYIHVFHIS